MKGLVVERGQVLYEPELPINAVHFPLTGMISLVHELREGEVVEVATVGHEGMSGISVFLGAAQPSERAIVQVAGRALRISALEFQEQIRILDDPLQNMLRRYTQAMFTQLGRNATCNRVHRVRQRAARWLMMCADRMERLSDSRSHPEVPWAHVLVGLASVK